MILVYGIVLDYASTSRRGHQQSHIVEKNILFKPSCGCLLGSISKLQDISKRIEDFTYVHDICTMAALLMIRQNTDRLYIIYYILYWSAMDGLAIFTNLCYTEIPTTTSGVSSLFAMSSFWFQPFSRAQKAPKTLACLARRHGDSWELDSTPLCNLPATPNWQKTIENVDSQKITFRPKYVNVFRRSFSCVVFGWW